MRGILNVNHGGPCHPPGIPTPTLSIKALPYISGVHCQGKSDDPQVNDDVRSYRQDLILTEATRRIRNETKLPPGQTDKRPLIVVLTKYDAWASIANGKPLTRDWILQEMPNGMNQFNVRHATK